MKNCNDLTTQDTEDRQYLDSLYHHARAAFAQCPLLHQHVATQRWLEKIYKARLAETNCLAQMTYPLLLLRPLNIELIYMAA